MKFKQIEYADRESWLQWRHNGLGSSDAPAVMGVSRFTKPEELLEKKSQPMAVEDDSNSYIKDRGNKIEQIVRRLYEEHMGMEFKAMSCQNIEHPFMLATLDGVDPGLNLMIEIKLLASVNPDKPNYETAGCIKWREVKKGVVPIDYYPQIQHQLAVTEIEACVFIGLMETRRRTVTFEDLAITTVLPDKDYQVKLVEKEKIFWNKVLKKREICSKVNMNGGSNEK